MCLTMYQRKRLREGRKWLGEPRKGLRDHISTESIAFGAGVFAVILAIAILLLLIRSGVIL